MSTENPRAFPSAAIDDTFGGMSLRDWFAGQALPAVLAEYPIEGWSGLEAASQEVAAISFAIADAMLAERARATS